MTTLTEPGVGAGTPAPPVEPDIGSARRTVIALALRESRLLLAHPGFWVGVALTAFGYWLGDTEARNTARVIARDAGFMLPPLLLAWAGLVTTNLCALRARRDGTEELFESMPTPAPARTTAHLLSVVALVPATVVLAVAAYAYWRGQPGAIGGFPLAGLTLMILLVVGAGVSGVLVARWVPIALGGPVAVIATIVLQSNFWYEDDRWRWLHFAAGDAFNTAFDIVHQGWHLVYVAGLVLLGGVLALARHGLSRRVSAAGATALVVLAVSGWVQTRPLPEKRVAARLSELTRPSTHQVCEERGGARYCAYRQYRSWIPLWAEPVEGVLDRLPPGAPSALEVRQRPLVSTYEDLLPRVAEDLDPAAVWAADMAVHPPMDWELHDHQLSLAYQAAAWAVGLPPAASWPGEACSAGGQARVVVAMWLAGRSTPEAGALLRTRAAEVDEEGQQAFLALRPLDVLPDYEGDGDKSESRYVNEVGSAGRGADVVAAASLLDVPEARVSRLLSEQWNSVVDPVTPVGALFELLGVPAPNRVADLQPVVPGVGRSCA